MTQSLQIFLCTKNRCVLGVSIINNKEVVEVQIFTFDSRGVANVFITEIILHSIKFSRGSKLTGQ